LRIPASGGWRGRLAKFAAIPAIGLVLAACSTQTNDNPTGDESAPNLFGETANGIGFPHDVVTTEGIASAGLYLPIFLIAVFIFVLVEGLLLYMALRYRKRSTGTDLPEQTHGNNKLEILWTVVPLITVFALFVVATGVLLDIESESEEHGAVVDVTAFRFGWIFDYMDPDSLDDEGAGKYEPLSIDPVTGGGREGAPTMVLPVGKPVLIRLSAVDVIHSWYVPSFFFKRDAIPGRVNEFELTIEQPGVYGGQCAEFCGLAHGDMFFSVDAMLPADYDAWVQAQSAGAGAPAADASPPDEVPTDASAASSEAVVLEIATTADKTIAFTTSDLEAPAGHTTTLVYSNESKVPHNVAIFDSPDASGNEIVQTETITGPGASTEATFTTPVEPGPYFFRCDIHPLQMTGTLTVTA
jgi:cytochrome c oxidase subunit 2